ncbi:bacterial peptide chain release factor 2 (bRF-2) [Mahella australiensis 50-1 BON]|uniref:Peptide chain release factor 2 n=1 Tax=Mahella australiensis (strain DSM 15567 / CIP 107919 / 50-1 BON) TaxID=697281 RepID=F3ZYM4_MAHA5|nr:bacterial peptide chain release factor 2 (bRF-2) [Mahella australiensis 50-1 BON]
MKWGLLFDPAGMEEEIKNLEKQMADPSFWSDMERSQKVNQRIKALKDKLQNLRAVEQKWEDLRTLADLGREEDDASIVGEVAAELASLRKEVERLRIETLLSGPYDRNNAIVTLHAGAGGTEAQDWVQMLYRMYTRWAEDKGYKVEVLDLLEGDEAGIKSVTFLVEGENAYGYLKAEKGVHRLVRISPFDAAGRRHTSFASVDVMPELDDDEGVEINPEDLKIDTYRSSGAGGQHVNKTESAIRITHIPTGIVVQCQNERSQHSNKETAMKMLKAKLLELKEQEEQAKISDIKGELKRIEWGSQIRSYIFQPYTMVKDHRTNAEIGNVNAVMDGDIDLFISEYLKMNAKQRRA